MRQHNVNDDTQKAIDGRVQVRKAPQYELRNLRPHGIALVPAGANARVCVMMKADDPHGDEMATKLRLSPTAKSAITNAMQTHLQSLNSTFALLTGADEDEAAEVPVELVEMLKSAASGLEALAKQYGKPMMDDEDEKKKRMMKAAEEVDKAGRAFARKNEATIRAAIAQHKETAAQLEAMLTPEALGNNAAGADVAKSASVEMINKLLDEKLAPVLKSVSEVVEKMAPKPAAEPRVIQQSNGAPTERPAPDVRSAPPYNPRDLDSVFSQS